MEAVPRLHMLWFALKSSPTGTSFASLKKYIAEFYQEDPESYSKEVFALETLRNQAMHPTKDGCSIMKRYYCQLHSLQNRFPQLADRNIFTFTWKDLYQNQTTEVSDMRYELAAVLFNIAASHTQVGASVTRGDVDGMKLACTHFQCAAWSFGELRERYRDVNSGGDFMTTELLVFMQQVSFAQAQECILEKSLIDNRKPNIVAKVTAQIVVYYGAALAALLTGGDDGPVAQVVESTVYKLWKKYVRFKISYLNCILYLYQGQHSEEQQKMGERVTLYQAAWDKLEEARKESKGLPDQKEINESLVFTADVVEAKRKNAKNENEFIYHEAIPELSSISAVQGANLVNGISFSVTDPEVAGDDIFARLVPMKAHEASSMYSEEKAKILRKYGVLIEDKDTELTSFMSSLTLENLNINEEKANKIPQGIVDRCAALNANKTAIPDLIASMSQLADTCADVEMNLKEIGSILSTEERQEREFQTATGVKRTPNAHITELTREYQKYMEAHSRAGESNDTLRKAMELHVNNLKILARPLQEIQQSVPKLSSELNTTEIFKDVKLILNKVNEMKAQRSQFHADLRIAVNDDDITTKVIAHGSEEGLQHLFEKELAKHERLTQLIDQNLLAQKNILQALTESYAKAAPILKTLADVKHKRENFFSSLAASYDVYEDLLAKSAKGLEFYKKLAGNVQKLLTRLKSARDVQSEEREQRLKNVANSAAQQLPQIPTALASNKDNLPTAAGFTSATAAAANAAHHTPTLRDYLKAKNTNAASIAAGGFHDNSVTPPGSATHNGSNTYIPPIRPNPLGSETPSQAACSGGYYTSAGVGAAGAVPPPPPPSGIVAAPNEPPPPYSLQQTQYYDPAAAGYTNPIYQQQQQNIAPPAYKLQASPNSQFTQLNTNLGNLSLQSGNYAPMQQPQQQPPPPQQQQPYATASVAPSNILTTASGYPSLQNMQNAANYQTPAQHEQLYQPPRAAAGFVNPIPQPNLPMPSGFGGVPNYAGNVALPPAHAASNTNTVAVPTQPTFMPPQLMNPQYPTMPTPTPLPVNYTAGAITGASIPKTQPLFVSTSTTDATNAMPASRATPPAALQAPYVVNPLQPALPQHTSIIPQQQQQQMLPQHAGLPQQTANSMATTTTAAATAPSSSSTSTPPFASSNASSIKHPGYSFNPQTGQYEYGSGYQQNGNTNAQFYGQYTSAMAMQQGQVGTTDSANAHKMNFATGIDAPIVSHTKSATAATPGATATANSANDSNIPLSYYTPPYGYHSHTSGGTEAAAPTSSNSVAMPQQTPGPPPLQQQQPQQPQQQLPQQFQQVQPLPSPLSQNSTYMQSGGTSIANTQTTKSAAEYASSPTQQSSILAANMKPTQTTAAATKPISMKKSSNIDLLTDIDFSGADTSGVPTPILPEPILKPVVVASPPLASHMAHGSATAAAATAGSSPKKIIGNEEDSAKLAATPPAAAAAASTAAPQIPPSLSLSQPTSTVIPSQHAQQHITSPTCDSPAPALRKASYDNLSICSDLSSLDNFDFETDSIASAPSTTYDKHSMAATTTTANTTFLLKPHDPFTDDKTLKYFHKEVERYEKIIESLNVKMLNGHTQLSAKWKELQEALAKDANKRTTTIAKLFPEKNRSLDCLPFDHARVKLEKNTDDYINAAYIKNLGTGCPNLIIAQTPQQNTINDFWSMIWSQKARSVLCLHTPNEMLDPFWPQELETETHFDDFSVKCIKVNTLSHSTEYYLKLSMHGADPIIDLSVLQIKSWTKSSLTQIIGIAQNAVHAHQQRCLEFNNPNSPLIMNCLTGSDRSELVAIAISAILATQAKRPLLINVVDVWCRICGQRQNAIRDTATLEQSMQIILTHAHDVLNKRGIMTSYQMKIAPQVASKEKEEIKDPLNELDPLWKLK